MNRILPSFCNKDIISKKKDLNRKIKLAAFDMDGTLITPFDTNKPWSEYNDPNDFKLKYKCIPKIMKILHNLGYNIVIFTNQKGIEKGDQDLDLMKKKIDNVIRRIGVHMDYCIATSDDNCYRKPNPGMWIKYIKNIEHLVDKEESFFVGDSAGRPGDYQRFDKEFAKKIGISFFTPEQFFIEK